MYKYNKRISTNYGKGLTHVTHLAAGKRPAQVNRYIQLVTKWNNE